MERIENVMLGDKISSAEAHKIFPIHYVVRVGILKAHYNIFVAQNIIKITHAVQMYKRMLPMKSGLYSINILYIGIHKNYPIHFGL